MTQSLGDRMKSNYEDRARFHLTRRIPVIVRVDGKAFHTFTHKFRKPFDSDFMASMTGAAIFVMRQASGCQAAYIQSDEASFLFTDYETLDTQGWFDYNKAKMESVVSSIMTAAFNFQIRLVKKDIPTLAFFDARAFNIPREEVVNYFLWRAQDWARNSLNMFCQSLFSHKQLQGKNTPELHEMLHKIRKNWTKDLSDVEKNGTFLVNGSAPHYNIQPTYMDIEKLLNSLIYPEVPEDDEREDEELGSTPMDG